MGVLEKLQELQELQNKKTGFFWAGVLLPTSVPVSGILATHQPGAIIG
jgi:hypothetical protein